MTPNPGPRHASPRHRRVSHRVQVRRRIAVGLLGLVILAIVLALVVPGGSSGRPGQRTSAGPTTTEAAASVGRSSTAGPGSSQSAKATHSIPAIEAGVLPWGLTAPISREVVLPGNGSGLTIVGGLAASQSSLASVFSLDTASGLTTPLGTLPSAVHDAAGALIGGRGYVFGGGSPNTVATVQQFGAPVPRAAGSANPENEEGSPYDHGEHGEAGHVHDGPIAAGGGRTAPPATFRSPGGDHRHYHLRDRWLRRQQA